MMDKAVIYTAGRLAEKRASTAWSWPRLVWRFGSYSYVGASLLAVQQGWIPNKPAYTALAVGIAAASAAWELITFVRSNSQRQDDQRRLKAAGYELDGKGVKDATLTCLADPNGTVRIAGQLPEAPSLPQP